MHSSECKATEYSPKARFGALIGFKPPFDRHDCVIDRDGKEVRYIVDYYHDKDPSNPDATKIDVRPALDSLDAFQVSNFLFDFHIFVFNSEMTSIGIMAIRVVEFSSGG